MIKKIARLTITRQISLALLVIFSIYMFFIFNNTYIEGSFDGILALFVIYPIFGLIICSINIIICLLIGLPIRLNTKLNNCWKNNRSLSIYGLILGLILIVLAFLPVLSESLALNKENPTGLVKLPHKTLSVSGWFLISFLLLHLYKKQS